MVTQPEAREVIAQNIVTDSKFDKHLGSSVTFDTITQEADGSGQDAAKTLPLISVTFSSAEESNYKNTDLVGYKLDADDNRIAEIYEREWEAEATIQLWTADGSDNISGVDQIADTLLSVLYGYDSSASNDDFVDENDNPVKGIWNFSLTGGVREDDLAQTPTVRRWEQTAEVYGFERYVTPEDVSVTSVDQTVQP